MKLNLKSQIDIDTGLIISTLSENGWEAVVGDMLEKIYYDNDPLIGLRIVISPKILHYENICHVWYACSFAIPESLIKDAQEYFLDLFKNLAYKPFKDEDATLGYFAQYNYNTIGQPKLNIGNFLKYWKHLLPKKYITTGFFLNPDYPSGYWSNHTIDTIKL